ncbi:VOC family protein [Pedobacter sp. ASV1-7]|uniref:VOC family protein n=1 Tax=Pedobacter sp. ASV1-7 TaxID=3145237 RepID=UPI0032E92A13
MTTINPYLNFAGTSEAAFNFYKEVFGGDITMIMRFRDMPDDKTPENEKDKICHISLQLPNGTLLMATDVLESLGQKLITGNNFYLSISAENRAEADRLFTKLSENGKVEMPMADMFWGDYFGITADKFGTQWMISFNTHM